MPEKARDSPVHRLPDWRLTLPLAQSCHRCGARTRSGASCKSPAMQNGRCRMHGGTSTGPRTSEGLERMRRANTRHGIYSEESRRQMRAIRKLVREAEQTAEKSQGFRGATAPQQRPGSPDPTRNSPAARAAPLTKPRGPKQGEGPPKQSTGAFHVPAADSQPERGRVLPVDLGV
jgi:hypothetical protein